MAGRKKARDPKIIRPDDINPDHNWDRPVGAPGHTQVDFEERINFRRLHDYRLARTRAALNESGLGALLSFDQHNIRYTTSTVIGEWARDKLTRYSLLTGNGDPYIWDFGSAAKADLILTYTGNGPDQGLAMHATWTPYDPNPAGVFNFNVNAGGPENGFGPTIRSFCAEIFTDVLHGGLRVRLESWLYGEAYVSKGFGFEGGLGLTGAWEL